MANFGQGDPYQHRGAGDPCRSAVDLHVDDDGGLVRSDDGRHAGHDGSGNDAVTGRIRSLLSAGTLRHWSSTSFGVSEFFATKPVTSVQPYTGRPSIQPAKLSQPRSSRTSRTVSTLRTLSPAFRSERGLRAQDERKTRRRDRRHAETAFLRFLNGVPVAGSGSRRPRWQTPQGAKESTAGGARRP